MQALAAAGVTRVVELGPGKVLCGLVKRIAKDIEVLNVEDPASLEKTLAAAGALTRGRPRGHRWSSRKGGAGHRRLARHRACLRRRLRARRGATVVLSYAGNEAAAQPRRWT